MHQRKVIIRYACLCHGGGQTQTVPESSSCSDALRQGGSSWRLPARGRYETVVGVEEMCFRLFPFILHPGSVEIEKSKTIVEASREGIGTSCSGRRQSEDEVRHVRAVRILRLHSRGRSCFPLHHLRLASPIRLHCAYSSRRLGTIGAHAVTGEVRVPCALVIRHPLI